MASVLLRQEAWSLNGKCRPPAVTQSSACLASPSRSWTPSRPVSRGVPKSCNFASIISCRNSAGAKRSEVSHALCRAAPESGTGFLHAGFCLHQLGKTAEAKKLLSTGPVALLKEPIYYYNMGCYEALLGNIRGAKENLRISFRMDASFRALAKIDPDLQALHAVI